MTDNPRVHACNDVCRAPQHSTQSCEPTQICLNQMCLYSSSCWQNFTIAYDSLHIDWRIVILMTNLGQLFPCGIVDWSLTPWFISILQAQHGIRDENSWQKWKNVKVSSIWWILTMKGMSHNKWWHWVQLSITHVPQEQRFSITKQTASRVVSSEQFLTKWFFKWKYSYPACPVVSSTLQTWLRGRKKR